MVQKISVKALVSREIVDSIRSLKSQFADIGI